MNISSASWFSLWSASTAVRVNLSASTRSFLAESLVGCASYKVAHYPQQVAHFIESLYAGTSAAFPPARGDASKEGQETSDHDRH